MAATAVPATCALRPVPKDVRAAPVSIKRPDAMGDSNRLCGIAPHRRIILDCELFDFINRWSIVKWQVLSASPDAIKTSRGEKRLRSSPPATDQQPAPKLSRPYAATNTTAHTQINTEMMNNQSSGTTQSGAAESTAIHGSVSAQWLIEFEQRILARFDNRFDEVSGRMSRLEEAQARQEATLTHELAEAADFRAACSREMMAFQRELRGEIEVACARIVSTTAVTGPREANETEEDSCEVRFDGLPSGVDPSSTETVKKILQAMGLTRFEMHIARVREWINRNPRSTDQSSSRQNCSAAVEPFHHPR
ncbi:unnamed protein product [Trichogramma brassicae]|uniref:Uncharacterized protein n=1 Tax=Trichogramma brassicae TaxID=86971 RepID=A0A6H5I4Z2_9HYME|nr:unnamed protein product [Trichogramma brassicae]